MSSELSKVRQQVTLTNCDTEPIHIPGSNQPHGVFIATRGPELTIVHIGENTQSILDIAPCMLLQA